MIIRYILSSCKIYLWMSMSLFLLQGCATLSKEECQRGDWFSIGRRDGSQGYLLTYFREHESACAEYGIQPNYSLYKRGRDEGLAMYCTPENGYHLGEQVATYYEVCPDSLKNSFLRQYVKGLEIAQRNLDREISSKNAEFYQKARLLSSTREDKAYKRLEDEIKQLESTINALQDKQRNIGQLLSRYTRYEY